MQSHDDVPDNIREDLYVERRHCSYVLFTSVLICVHFPSLFFLELKDIYLCRLMITVGSRQAELMYMETS